MTGVPLTHSENVLLQLVAKAINKDYSLALDDFKNVNWEKVLKLSVRQCVVGVAYDAIELLPVELSPERPTLLKWIGYVARMEGAYERYRETIFSLADFYAENGYKMMLLKGYGLSSCYPVPERRPTGDIDIFLGREGATPPFGQKDVWKEADRLLQNKLNIKVDNTHHHHSVFMYKRYSVENHFDFINVYDHKSSREFEKLFKQMAAEGYKVHPECPNLYLPSDDFNALFLLKHCSGHFASTEINLRQVLDWLLFIRTHHDTIDRERLYTSLQEFGLVRFANILSTVGVKYLGMSSAEFYAIEKDEALVLRVLKDILSPEFKEHENGTLLSGLWIKPRRFWHNRWKHRLCYRDSFVSGFIWSTYAKLLKPRHFRV